MRFWSDLTEFDEALAGGENRPRAEADKETVLDHARDAVQRLRERFRGIDPGEVGVEDMMAPIGHEGRSRGVLAKPQVIGQSEFPQKLPERYFRRPQTEWDDFDRQGEPSENLHALRAVG